MSTLVVSNISDGTTTVGASYVTNGSAKAWGNLNGVTTTTIRSSLNLSSITDNGTGDTTTSFTASFASVDYVFGSNGNNTLSGLGRTQSGPSVSAMAVGSFRFRTFDSGQGLTDHDWMFPLFHGDLA